MPLHSAEDGTHPADGSFGVWALITLRVKNIEVVSEAAGLDSMSR